MTGLEVLGLIATGLAIVAIAVTLWRQGFPGKESGEDSRSGGGPTGVKYSPGSRPAGPGAEDMIRDPSPDESD